MFAWSSLYTTISYLFYPKHVNLLQQRIVLCCLTVQTHLLHNPPFFTLCSYIWIYVLLFKYIYGTHGLYSLGVMHDTRYCVHCCTRNGISCSVLRFNHVNKSCYWRLKIHSIHMLLLNALHSQKILYMWLVVLRAWYMTWWLLDTRILNVRNFTQCTV